MAYTNAQPQGTQLVSAGQGTILANFVAIDSGTTGTGIGFARNHVTMTDGTNGGLHHRVDYYQAVSSPAISGFISSLYPKTVTHAELFYKNGTADMQISNSLLTASSGQGMLPGGLLIKCGIGNGSTNVVYTNPFTNACLVVNITAYANNRTWDVASLNGASGVTGFTPQPSSGGGGDFFWTAIGY